MSLEDFREHYEDFEDDDNAEPFTRLCRDFFVQLGSDEKSIVARHMAYIRYHYSNCRLESDAILRSLRNIEKYIKRDKIDYGFYSLLARENEGQREQREQWKSFIEEFYAADDWENP
jgi:hypothetical protein